MLLTCTGAGALPCRPPAVVGKSASLLPWYSDRHRQSLTPSVRAKGLADCVTFLNFLSWPVSHYHFSLHQTWQFKVWPDQKPKSFKFRPKPGRSLPAACCCLCCTLIGNTPEAPGPSCWFAVGELACLRPLYSESLAMTQIVTDSECQHFPWVWVWLTESRYCLDQLATITPPSSRLGNLKSSPVQGPSFSSSTGGPLKLARKLCGYKKNNILAPFDGPPAELGKPPWELEYKSKFILFNLVQTCLHSTICL